MPTLKQKMTTYLRQLSFIAEPRERPPAAKASDNGCFITKYLEGRTPTTSNCPIYNGKEPIDLPDLQLNAYRETSEKVTAAYTGPDAGLCGIKRNKMQLDANQDIDFIDTNQEQEVRQNPVVASKYKYQKRPPSRKNSTTSIAAKDLIASAIKTDNQINNNLNTSIDNVVLDESSTQDDLIADITNWNMPTEQTYGMSVSLYEKNPATQENAGSPIADCFGLITRGNVSTMALSDGVNWGEGARMAARAAIQGSLDYLNRAIFDPSNTVQSTREVFMILLRSFWEAQDCILETGGALTTLTVCVVLPLTGQYEGKYVVCSCNVGDSLGYVYSKVDGVREFTIGSHDVNSNRDMRDALGALGPCFDGNKPELGNLTLSLTIVESGDIVFLTSDGVSDNFDPVVGKFAEAFTAEALLAQKENKDLAPKRQTRSATNVYNRRTKTEDLSTKISAPIPVSTKNKLSSVSFNTADIPVRPPRTKKLSQLATASASACTSPELAPRPKYSRSKTLIEPRLKMEPKLPTVLILKSATGLPLITGNQRHALTLLRLADLFLYGINGTLKPCVSAKKLCHLLIDFVKMITMARRKLLEQRELFYKTSFNADGTRREVELNRLHQRNARKRVVDSATFVSLPGKLDHASVVATVVGFAGDPRHSPVLMRNIALSSTYTETNF